MNPAYAPPLKLVLPFFVVGVLALLAFALLEFCLEKDLFLSFKFAGLTHLFLLGFVMMIIVGSLAQLLPVALESPHKKVNLYYLIAPLLTLGFIGLVFAFLCELYILPYAASLLIIGFLLFIYESVLSILTNFKLSFTRLTLLFANAALFIGLCFGVLLGLDYLGELALNPAVLLLNHIAFMFSFIYLVILSISLILLPMFWVSHKLSFLQAKFSLGFYLIAIVLLNLTPVFKLFLFLSLACFLAQLYLVYKNRVRKGKDIYFKATMLAIYSLCILVCLACFNSFKPLDTKLLNFFYFVLAWGFLGQLIAGHLYKILPFLVWFKVFSPLVGKQKVPSFSQMLPSFSIYNYYFTLAGLILAFFDLVFKSSFCLVLAKLSMLLAVVVLILALGKVLFIKNDVKEEDVY